MSRDGRKPWMTPVQYNDDRWAGSNQAESGDGRRHGQDSDPPSRGPSDNGEERDARDIEEILNRPDEREEREYECNDTTPINYKRGPHDEEFGVDEHDFDEPDTALINYDKGPHEEEFGIEDDEELEPLDGEPEFPEV